MGCRMSSLGYSGLLMGANDAANDLWHLITGWQELCSNLEAGIIWIGKVCVHTCSADGYEEYSQQDCGSAHPSRFLSRLLGLCRDDILSFYHNFCLLCCCHES